MKREREEGEKLHNTLKESDLQILTIYFCKTLKDGRFVSIFKQAEFSTVVVDFCLLFQWWP